MFHPHPISLPSYIPPNNSKNATKENKTKQGKGKISVAVVLFRIFILLILEFHSYFIFFFSRANAGTCPTGVTPIIFVTQAESSDNWLRLVNND